MFTKKSRQSGCPRGSNEAMRRFFQFRLRTLFILTAVATVACALGVPTWKLITKVRGSPPVRGFIAAAPPDRLGFMPLSLSPPLFARLECGNASLLAIPGEENVQEPI